MVSEKIQEAKREPDFVGIWNPDVTVGEYAKYWIDNVQADLEPKTHCSYDHLLSAHVLPFKIEGRQIGDLKIRDLKRRHVKALVNAKKAAGYAKDSVRLMRSVLSSLLTDAQDDEIIDQNPALMLFRKMKKKEKHSENDITPMEESELAAFIEAAKNEKGFGVFLTTLGKTGIRPSEGIALTPGDVRFDKRTLHIEKVYASSRIRPYTKTGIKRDVDLSPEMVELLHTHISRLREEYFMNGEPMPDMLFPNACGHYLDNDNAGRAFHRISKKAKLGYFRMYDLRHTFASLLLASGAPITYVSAQLGHAKPTTTLRYYARWLPKEGKRYVDLLDAKPDRTEAAVR
jgi:integrase